MTPSFPNPLFDRGREVLARFGFQPLAPGDLRDDYPQMWEQLKGDFATTSRPVVPGFGDLDDAQRAVAEEYMDLRVLADRRVLACERCHAELLRQGIDSDLVELYTSAREAYEDTVIAFGEARSRLDGLLPSVGGG